MKLSIHIIFTFFLTISCGICIGINSIKAQDKDSSLTIKAGVYENSPKIFIDNYGKPKGFFIDILESVTKTENIHVEYVIDEWPILLKKLENGTIDILPDVAYTNERDSLFDLSTPVLGSWIQVYTTNETVINAVNDLKDKKIGVLSGSIQESFLNNNLFKDSLHKYKIIPFEDYPESVKALKNNSIDVIVANRFFYFSDLCDSEIIPTGVILQLSDLHFAFSKKADPDLIDLFNQNIYRQKNNPDSDYYKALQKWFSKKDDSRLSIMIIWIIIIFLLIIIIISSFALLLRNRVKSKTGILSIKNEELSLAMERIEESEKKLQQLADHIPNGMIYQAVIDKNGNKIFTYFSKAVEKLYGHSTDEVLKNPQLIYQRIHPDDIENLIKLEDIAIKNMSLFQTEARVYNPDNSIRWSYFVSSPRMHKNKFIFDGIEIDISKQKQVEMDLIAAKEKAIESDRLKSVFLQNMSHEIRTPMNGILGFISLMENPDLDSKSREQYVDIINRSGQRLIKTLNDIIEISQLDSNQITVNYSPVKLSEVIDNLHDLFKGQANEKGLTFSINNSLKGDNDFVKTDRNIIDRILSYLIGNAIKFTEKGLVKLQASKSDNQIIIVISDTGIGISPERLEAIFDRFVQADMNITRPQEGTGLGLSIVKAYMELLNGSISVVSELQKGSTFTITFPCNDPL